MDNCDFNPETLIELVKRRPILWDRSLEEHKSRIVISRNWREVCNELNDNFQSLENKEKDEYGKNYLNYYLFKNLTIEQGMD